MRKNIFLLIFVAAGIISVSAKINFEVPTDVISNNYAKFNASGVNLRQGPSASSKKLVIDCEDETDNCWFDYKTSGNAVHPEIGQTYPVLNQGGDWAYLAVTDEYIGSTTAWVMNKFVNILQPAEMSARDLANNHIYSVESLGCPGCYIFVDVNDPEQSVYLGKKIGNQYVFPYRIISSYYEDQDAPYDVNDMDYMVLCTYNDALMKVTHIHNEWGDWDMNILNVDALTPESFEEIFGPACKISPDYVKVVNSLGTFFIYL